MATELIITLPYDIGDTVWLMKDNTAFQDEIEAINLSMIPLDPPAEEEGYFSDLGVTGTPIYILKVVGNKTSDEFFASKAALLASL